MPRLALLLFTLGLLLPGLSLAVEKRLPLSLELEPGKSQRVQLKNLMRGSTLFLQANASCQLQLALRQLSPTREIHTAIMATTWTSTYYIHESGDYQLQLHNRSDSDCTLSGVFGARMDLADTGQPEVGQADMQKISREIQKVFIAEDIEYILLDCDTANSFARQSTVILCREHIEKIQAYAPDNAVAKNLLLFVLMHETSHVLLEQWQYPFSTNEDVVDEFAVVLLRLMQQDAAITDQADYFDEQPAMREYRHKLENDDRHTLSVQRARNLRAWSGDDALLGRWMGFLVPHIQTDALRKLAARSGHELKTKISEELEKRGSAS